MPSDPQVLIAQAKCYECFGPITIAQALRLSTLANALIKLNPMASTDPQSLMAYGKCFACFGLSAAEIMEISLLDQIANAAGGGGGPGVTPNLSQVLTQGNNAGNQSEVNVAGIELGAVGGFTFPCRVSIAGAGANGQCGIEYLNTDFGRWATYVGVGGNDAWGLYSQTIGGDVFVFTSVGGGRVGILNSNPNTTLDVSGAGAFSGALTVGSNLNVSTDGTFGGNLDVTGKVTATGGIDPPYLLLDRETRASIKERVLKEVPVEKQEGQALFMNSYTGKLEIYVAASDKYYSLDGTELI